MGNNGPIDRVERRMSGDSPNPLLAGWSMLRSMRVGRPQPVGGSPPPGDAELAAVLSTLRDGGVPALAGQRAALSSYRATLESVDPDRLTRDESLAFWINLYNAGALNLAAEAFVAAEPSVLRVPGAFRKPWTNIAGRRLSLDDIEHGKIRRFEDPRIHSALVCGSASCPTLRYEPFRGADLDSQLEHQMRNFVAAGGASYDAADGKLRLSRVFLWYGSDFVRPHRMPTWIPVRKRAVAHAVSRWLDPQDRKAAATARVEFTSYDWGLACSIG